jgi:hypothetical protein
VEVERVVVAEEVGDVRLQIRARHGRTRRVSEMGDVRDDRRGFRGKSLLRVLDWWGENGPYGEFGIAALRPES